MFSVCGPNRIFSLHHFVAKKDIPHAVDVVIGLNARTIVSEFYPRLR